MSSEGHHGLVISPSFPYWLTRLRKHGKGTGKCGASMARLARPAEATQVSSVVPSGELTTPIIVTMRRVKLVRFLKKSL
ncbi:hypothetical protein PoB_006114900 [Plakobranchus ocellatus]|uniref:Uncharacterized protein n=1 Tax=Plakobranchus ocellatus TaxID=259542 RepID=A0AAV4CRZ8_9GAST|nr:hypothetical protein PoB_006114900 [Plakobranchus ocellatus]